MVQADECRAKRPKQRQQMQELSAEAKKKTYNLEKCTGDHSTRHAKFVTARRASIKRLEKKKNQKHKKQTNAPKNVQKKVDKNFRMSKKSEKTHKNACTRTQRAQKYIHAC